MMKKPVKEIKANVDDRTFFERQEDAWLDNLCQGNIEDYDGNEEPSD